ncbi:hypothetical protein K3V69_14725, partial [Listeria monocytogenes]|nr:hypothetical protein [Listeria monocytogenes]
ETLSERLRESAFLLKGMLIELIDARVGMAEPFHFEEGVKNFVEYINEGKDVLHPVDSFEGENATIEVEMAFQFNDGYYENILRFVNYVRTRGS